MENRAQFRRERKMEEKKVSSAKKISDKLESNFVQIGGLLFQNQFHQGVINASNARIMELRKENGELTKLLTPEEKPEVLKSE